MHLSLLPSLPSSSWTFHQRRGSRRRGRRRTPPGTEGADHCGAETPSDMMSRLESAFRQLSRRNHAGGTKSDCSKPAGFTRPENRPRRDRARPGAAARANLLRREESRAMFERAAGAGFRSGTFLQQRFRHGPGFEPGPETFAFSPNLLRSAVVNDLWTLSIHRELKAAASSVAGCCPASGQRSASRRLMRRSEREISIAVDGLD